MVAWNKHYLFYKNNEIELLIKDNTSYASHEIIF